MSSGFTSGELLILVKDDTMGGLTFNSADSNVKIGDFVIAVGRGFPNSKGKWIDQSVATLVFHSRLCKIGWFWNEELERA